MSLSSYNRNALLSAEAASLTSDIPQISHETVMLHEAPNQESWCKLYKWKEWPSPHLVCPPCSSQVKSRGTAEHNVKREARRAKSFSDCTVSTKEKIFLIIYILLLESHKTGQVRRTEVKAKQFCRAELHDSALA